MQAAIAKLGEEMGFRIWLPKNDRSAVCANWKPQAGTLIDVLPLNYDHVTIATIEQIDVLWLKGRSIRRAFEVEHTTSIYSGIVRMLDLALGPCGHMLKGMFLVAPDDREAQIRAQLARPAFASVAAMDVRYLSYSELDRHREAIIRFGEGLKAIRSIAKVLN